VKKRVYRLMLMLFLVALAVTPSMVSRAGDKITAEQVVAKHLEAIGPAETRASIKSILAGGKATVTFRSPATAQLSGQVVLASDGKKNMVGMIFEDSKYSHEKFGFDGQEVTAGYVRPGVHSTLGDFLLTHKIILKQGVVSGALSTAWPLLNLSDKTAKLEYAGTKKIRDRSAHELRYLPRGGSDIEIRLYFDAENYHHLRTEYSRVITAQLGASIDASAAQRETRYKLTEDFSEFKRAGALVLPHSYKLQLELDTRGGTYLAEWKLALSDFDFNQTIPPSSFKLSPAQ